MRIVRGRNDESEIITCHQLEFTILCHSLLHHPDSPYPVRLFSQRRHDVLLFYRRARPASVPRRSRRERQDRRKGAWRHEKQPSTTLEFKIYPYVQSPSLPLQIPRFHDCSPRQKEPLSPPLLLETPSSTSPISTADSVDDVNSVDFVARVSTIPLVNTALRAYDYTKASSRVVKVRFLPLLLRPPPSFSLPPRCIVVSRLRLVWRRNDGIIRKDDIKARYWSIARHSTGRVRLQAVRQGKNISFSNRPICSPALAIERKRQRRPKFRITLTCFPYSLADMAAVSRGLPFRKNAKTKQRPQHLKVNLALNPVLKRIGPPVVPRRLDQNLSNTLLSRGVVGRLCSSKLVDLELP